MNIADWVDGGDPHDPARSLQQLTWLQEWGHGSTRRVLDLGCGEGRALVTLARAGHEVVGIDTNASALATCREGLGEIDAGLVEADFTAPKNGRSGPRPTRWRQIWPSSLFDCVFVFYGVGTCFWKAGGIRYSRSAQLRSWDDQQSWDD